MNSRDNVFFAEAEREDSRAFLGPFIGVINALLIEGSFVVAILVGKWLCRFF